MSYSNEQASIKAGLVNYIGALLASSPFEGTAARHNVVSALAEQVLKLGYSEDETVDMHALKPLFRASNIAIAKKCAELQKEDPDKNRNTLEQYKDVLMSMKDLIDNIEKIEEER